MSAYVKGLGDTPLPTKRLFALCGTDARHVVAQTTHLMVLFLNKSFDHVTDTNNAD